MDAETLARSIEVRAQTEIPTKYGPFKFIVFHSLVNSGQQHDLSRDHVALIRGDVRGKSSVLVRVHSECITSEVFGSLRCDCQEQLVSAQMEIERSGCGVLVYLRQEGRGIGLANKIQAYNLQHIGHDTVEANLMLGLPEDARDYQPAAAILAQLGIASIRLITNNPLKVDALRGHGIAIDEQVPVIIEPNPFSANYLDVKRRRMGHTIPPFGSSLSSSEPPLSAPGERSHSPETPGNGK